MNNTQFNSEINTFKVQIIRYLSFWPFFVFSVLFFIFSGFIYLRYVDYTYLSEAKIEIYDKAQDSEMALPTSMTIFNRSMINLQNEIGVLNSYNLNKRVVDRLMLNIKFYSIGRVKTTQNYISEWTEYVTFNLKDNIDISLVKNPYYYIFFISDDNLIIEHYNKNDVLIEEFSFPNFTTYDVIHSLPFNISINDINDFTVRKILFSNYENTVRSMMNSLDVKPSSSDSDQLDLTHISLNPILSSEYLNSLIFEFDQDGIKDRQLEYSRTIEFVNTRSKFLSAELEQIELKKRDFKSSNNFNTIDSNLQTSTSLQIDYNSQLFKIQSQKELVKILFNFIDENGYKLIPINVGLDDNSINTLIIDYNLLVKQKDKFLLTAGKNNQLIKSIEYQLENSKNNIKQSIEKHIEALDLKIINISEKEEEFKDIFNSIPENEKILRSIERELQVKESLFILLLQKKEEASINFAVVKPSIKVIDDARINFETLYPQKKSAFLFSVILGFFIPFSVISLVFYFDNKIHTKEDLTKLIDIPVIAEIPHIKENSNKNQLIDNIKDNSRDILIESIRMLIANLKFTEFKSDKKQVGKVFLVTSSIKGEGKTLISSRLSKVLSFSSDKTILIGADLRNPQLHKTIGIDKSTKGLSDYIYRDDLDWRSLVQKSGKLETLLSGTIPPNPTELLSSEKFKLLIDELKSIYDYIIIDSAPCLLVADTLQFSNYVDNSIVVVRSNYTKKDIISFISELRSNDKLNRINLILNGVGNSSSYGYKYGYQYGYKYGYKYGYNYGYGYGYNEDS